MDNTPRLAINWKKNLVFIGISQFLAMVGELQARDRSVIDELSRKIDDIVVLLGVVA